MELVQTIMIQIINLNTVTSLVYFPPWSKCKPFKLPQPHTFLFPTIRSKS
jgi:hypothetical protein